MIEFKLKPTNSNLVIMLIIGALVYFGSPLAMIWAFNTLFPSIAIPYTIETWLAAFIIPAVFKSNITLNK